MNRPRNLRNQPWQKLMPSVVGRGDLPFSHFTTALPRAHRAREGAVFRPRFWLAMGVLWGVTGCSLVPPAPPPVSPLVKKRAQQLARYNSVGKALARLDGPTIKTWISRWSSPQKAGQRAEPRAVRINAEVLAARHPAWLLANALESGAVAPNAPQVARVLAQPSLAAPFLVGDLSTSTSTRPTLIIDEPTKDRETRARQNAALDSFFAATEARDALRGKDEAFLARRALEDSIAVAQRGAVSQLDLSLVPPDVALELTNLRLQLLRSLGRTPEQRRATRTEIAAIEDRYNEIWSQQTALQAAKLREATRDLPARQRISGLEKIAAQGQENAQNRARARTIVQRDIQNRLEADMGEQHADLHLVLPPVPTLNSKNLAGRQFFETSENIAPSLAPTKTESEKTAGDSKEPLARIIRQSSPVVAQLRAKARREARLWASLVAAQLGSRWDNSPRNPDRTGVALDILFPAPQGKSLF